MVSCLKVAFPLLTFLLTSNAQKAGLIAVRANSSLPTPRRLTAAEYDGSDAIYIFGGYQDGRLIDEILKYSISMDAIQTVAHLPVTSGTGLDSGTTSADSEGNIYFHGGFNGTKSVPDIFKYFPANNSINLLGHSLPTPNSGSAVVKGDSSSESVLILGGWLDRTGIVSFNMDTSPPEAERVGNLSRSYNYFNAISDGKGSAYLFGDTRFESVGQLQAVGKLNLSSLEMSYGPPNFPSILRFPGIVWDSLGNHAYLIGGYGNDALGIKTNSIIRFNPATWEAVIIPVLNVPEFVFQATSAVFVAKLNRIYFFGGFSRVELEHEEIWYIDLPN